MTCRPLDLVAELTDAVLFCEARIQREGLVLVYNEPEEMIPVYADPDRLRQVFINIMDNAIKYSAPGGRITVKLWACLLYTSGPPRRGGVPPDAGKARPGCDHRGPGLPALPVAVSAELALSGRADLS